MKKRASIIILLFSLILNTSNIIAQKIPYMTQIDSKEMKYIDNTEVSISDWREYEFDMKNRFGSNSQEFLSTIPDTALFRRYYNYSFIHPNANNMEKQNFSNADVGFMKNNYDKYPMIGVSYEQCIDYCKWRTERFNWKIKGVEQIEFSLPTQEDYKKAESYAEITFNPPLSILKDKKSGKPQGITDNVIEYTLGNKDQVLDRPIGFRCIAKIIK